MGGMRRVDMDSDGALVCNEKKSSLKGQKSPSSIPEMAKKFS